MSVGRPIDQIRHELEAAENAHAVAPDDGAAAERLETLRDELARAEGRAEGTISVYERDERLVRYRVHFVSGLEYRFWAEDARHAAEQAMNAEPGETVLEVHLERDAS
jgi:hypothetical protein